MNLQVPSIDVTGNLIDHVCLIQVCDLPGNRIEHRYDPVKDPDPVEVCTIAIGREKDRRVRKGIGSGTSIRTDHVLLVIPLRLISGFTEVLDVNLEPVVRFTYDQIGGSEGRRADREGILVLECSDTGKIDLLIGRRPCRGAITLVASYNHINFRSGRGACCPGVKDEAAVSAAFLVMGPLPFRLGRQSGIRPGLSAECIIIYIRAVIASGPVFSHGSIPSPIWGNTGCVIPATCNPAPHSPAGSAVD